MFLAIQLLSRGKCYPIVTEDYKIAIDKAKKQLRGLLYAKNLAPLMLRLAYVFIFVFCNYDVLCDIHVWLLVVCRWNSAATYDVQTKTGGPFGTMRFEAEQNHAANRGLDEAVRELESIRKKFPLLSYADLYQVV